MANYGITNGSTTGGGTQQPHRRQLILGALIGLTSWLPLPAV